MSLVSPLKKMLTKLGVKSEQAASAPKIAVMGQYKTGTTALFFRIKNSLNCEPRLLFEAAEYVAQVQDRQVPVLAKVMLQPGVEPQVVNYSSFFHFDFKLYITRDPRDRFVSDLLFAVQQNESIHENQILFGELMRLLRAKEANPSSVSLVTISRVMAEGRTDRAPERRKEIISELHDWLFNFEKQLSNHLRIRYEDFVHDDVRNVEKYMRMKLPGRPEVDGSYPHVRRTSSSGDWRHWYTPEDIRFFKEAMQPYIERYGYPRLWDTAQNQVINPQHCSQYVERTVKLRKPVA